MWRESYKTNSAYKDHNSWRSYREKECICKPRIHKIVLWEKSTSGIGRRMFFPVGCFFHPLRILLSKATVTPFPCDLRRCQLVQEIHDSRFIRFSNLPPILLLHMHHARVRVQDWKVKIFLQLTLWLMALCSCQCGKWSLPQRTHLCWERNYSCPSVTEWMRYKIHSHDE